MSDDRLISYFQLSDVVEMRLGAGSMADIFRLDLAAPSILACVPEMPGQRFETRVRFGRVDVTDDDRLVWHPLEPAQRRGVPIASIERARCWFTGLHQLTSAELEYLVSQGSGSNWIAFGGSEGTRQVNEVTVMDVALGARDGEPLLLADFVGGAPIVSQRLAAVSKEWAAVAS